MDDQYALSVAKTEYREAYNTGDVERLLSVFAPGFIDCTDGEPSFYGAEARQVLELRARKFFARYKVDLIVIIANIIVKDDTALARGWHRMKLTDKQTGESSEQRSRYFETWIKLNGEWKIFYFMTNREIPPALMPEVDDEPSRGSLDKKLAG